MQTARLRELARDYGLPDSTAHRVEGRISDGLTQDDAFRLIQQLGGRIAQLRAQQARPALEAHRPAPRPNAARPNTLALETTHDTGLHFTD